MMVQTTRWIHVRTAAVQVGADVVKVRVGIADNGILKGDLDILTVNDECPSYYAGDNLERIYAALGVTVD